MNKYKVTARKEPNEKGLARVAQGTRGYDLFVNGKCVGQVKSVGRYDSDKWYYYFNTIDVGVVIFKNTYLTNEIFPTKEEAKTAAVADLRKELELP